MSVFAHLVPFIGQLGNYLKMGMDYYADLKMAGKEATPEIVAVYLRVKIATWDPEINGRPLLDDPTRTAAARFLAGVAVNFVGV